MSELPDNWIEVEFAELNEFTSKNINPTDTPNVKFELYSVPIFPTRKPEIVLGSEIGSAKQTVCENDVLVCKINPRINRVWQVSKANGLRQIASSEWIVLRASRLNPSYLRYYFSSYGFREMLCQDLTGVGGSLTRAQPKRVAKLVVPLAPLNEQKRIADKLDTLLAAVDSCRARLENIPTFIKRFRQSVLAAATSGTLSEEPSHSTFRRINVGALLLDIRYGTSKKCEYEPRETPVIRIPNISRGFVSHADLKYAKFDDGEHKKLSLISGDILIIRSNGSVDLVGRTALVTKADEGFLFAGYLIRLRVNPQIVNPAYLSLALSAPDTRNEIENTARSTSGVNNINTEEIKALEISLPSLVEQNEIVRRVEHLLAIADKLEASLATARKRVEQLTPAILAQAFRGELVAQDPNDEPASALLARITAAASPKRAVKKAA